MNELARVARRKLGFSWPETHVFLATVRALLTVEPFTATAHDLGLAIAERYGLSMFDAMIVASALQADCDTLWTEDMHDSLLIENRLRIANPFRSGRCLTIGINRLSERRAHKRSVMRQNLLSATARPCAE